MSENIFKVGKEAPQEFDALWQGRTWEEMELIDPVDVLCYGIRGHKIPDEETANRLWAAYEKYRQRAGVPKKGEE